MRERYKSNMYWGENAPNSRHVYPKNKRVELVSDDPAVMEIDKIVKESLASIDQETLREIYQEYYGRVGIDVSLLSIPDTSEVSIIYEPELEIKGGFHTDTGIVVINVAQLADVPHSSLPELIKHIFIHECFHRISTGTPLERTHRDSNQVQRTFELNIGLAKVANSNTRDLQSGVTTPKTEFLNVFADEGLTEILTTKVQREYNQRLGERSTEIDADHERGFGLEFYSKNQLKVRLLIIFYSTILGATEDSIENSLIRAYLRNGATIPNEIKAILPNFNPKELEQWLEKPDDIQVIENILEEYYPDFANSTEIRANFYKRVLALKESELYETTNTTQIS